MIALRRIVGLSMPITATAELGIDSGRNEGTIVSYRLTDYRRFTDRSQISRPNSSKNMFSLPLEGIE